MFKTFVDAGPLAAVLAARDHLLIYGRRGTGKTHALAYSVEDINRSSPYAVFVDLRTVGSDTSLYGDTNLPITQRGTRLLLDVLGACHDKLVTFALEGHGSAKVLPLLDMLSDQITDTRVEGATEIKEEAESSAKNSDSSKLVGQFSEKGVTLKAETGESSEAAESRRKSIRKTGAVMARVRFGGITKILNEVIAELGIQRLWLVFDEWSTVPLDLQPLLADLIRRAILPCPRVTVKIGAIEQRMNVYEKSENGDYLGFEMGADISSAVNLDDFMVFGNDAVAAERFFGQMFFNHLNAHFVESGHPELVFKSAEDFISSTFTQQNGFRELVRACEGVARDAINIASGAAQRADRSRISVHDVREAARTWYQRDKEKPIPDEAKRLLIWIIENVIRGRKARAFLLEQGEASKHELIRQLFDFRILHIVKRGISAKDQPGRRFDVYAIDYGCYVELLTTSEAPAHLFYDDDGASVDVPLDDYRSIRRAVLNLKDFEQTLNFGHN